MYGVVWATPPHTPATSVDAAFGQQHVAGAVVVARRARAFADVDPAHHHQQAERQQQRQVRHRRGQTFDEPEAGPRQHQLQRQRTRPGKPGRAQPRRAQSVIEDGADHERHEHPRQLHRQAALGDQHVQQQTQGHEPDDGRAQRLHQRQEAHQHQCDAGNGSQQTRARHQPGHRFTGKRQRELQRPHHHQRRHPQLPGRDGRGTLGQALLLESDERRSQHQQRHADARGRVQAERHRGDVVATGARRQAARHHRVDHVADQHPQRGAGKHPVEHHLGRKPEDPDQRRGNEAQDREVVDHQPEETVEVAGDEPAGRSG